MEGLHKQKSEGPESLGAWSNEACVFLRSGNGKILPKGLDTNLMPLPICSLELPSLLKFFLPSYTES